MINQSKAFSSFSVLDLEETQKFYSEYLGIKTTIDEMNILEINVNDGFRVIAYPKSNHKPAEFTVLNFLVSDIDQTVKELTTKGIVFEQYDEPIKTDETGVARNEFGPPIAWFKDPSGNILSLIEE